MRTHPIVLLAAMAAVAAGVAFAVLPPQVGAGDVGSRADAAATDLPLRARAEISATIGRDDPAYAMRTAGMDVVELRNPRHDLTARIDDVGVSLGTGAERIGLAARSWGFGTALAALPAGTPTARANRVDITRGRVTEWFVNGPLGLQQGFTVHSRPTTGSGALTIALDVTGLMTPRLADTETVAFTGSDLRYHGLAAWDARGRILPARFALDGRRIFIRVDDREARYPVTIDPLVQQALLTSSDGAADDQLGAAVAIEGDTVVVGAPDPSTVTTNLGAGAVYVFEKGAAWGDMTQTAKLTASDGAQHDRLGSGVAISGDTIVASAPGDDIGAAQNQGSAYVFVRSGATWANTTENAKLLALDGVAGDTLASVAISGGTIVAGATEHGGLKGAVYVFEESVGGWAGTVNSISELTASDGVLGDRLGWSVGIFGDTAVGGAPRDDGRRGAAYVFAKPAGGWASATQTAKLTASDGAGTTAELGYSVAVSQDTVVAGAYRDNAPNTTQGSAYVFVKPATGWITMTQTAKLTASDGEIGDGLGHSVGIDGVVVVAGAPFDDAPGSADRGAVYEFVKPAEGWTNMTETVKGVASSPEGASRLGFAVAVDGATVAAGANGRNVGTNTDQGAVHVFEDDSLPPQGSIVVEVQTTPDGAAQVFTLNPSWGASIQLADGQQSDSGPLEPGTYSVQALLPEGWALDLAGTSCSDGSPVDSIDLQLGETVRCTIAFIALPNIVLEVQTTPNGAAQVFTLNPSWGASIQLADGQQSDSGPLEPGTYSISLPSVDGWRIDLTGTSCSDASPPFAIELELGETVRCTIAFIALPNIILEVQTTPNGAAQLFTFNPSWGDSFQLADGQQSDSGPLEPGTYSLQALIPDGWAFDLDGTSCSDGSQTFAINLQLGETVTCTIAFGALPHIILEVQTSPDGDAQVFTLNPSWGASIQLADGQQSDSGPLERGTYAAEPGPLPNGWTIDAAGTGCNDGSLTSAIDVQAGEVTTCTFAFTAPVDNTPPAPPVITGSNPPSPNVDTTPVILGTAEPNSTVRVYSNGSCRLERGTGSADASGAFAIEVTVSANTVTSLEAKATDAAGNASSCSSPFFYSSWGPPAAPVLTGTTPGSPSNVNSMSVTGTVDTASGVIQLSVFRSADCSGVIVWFSPVGPVASPFQSGPISVNENATTSFSARATGFGGTSVCSNAIAYVEDSTAPTAPTLTATAPASPANDNNPEVQGSAEAASTITLFTTADCSGPPAATGTAEQLATPGLTVTVADNSTTTFRATSTDTTGNTSSCSTPLTYVEDSTPQDTTRVSLTSDGTQADLGSLNVNPAVSADGRFVAFQSSATNLVTQDTNGAGDVFVRDRLNGQTTRVSVSTAGAQANSSSGGAVISADGRFVAFHSTASNLVAGDTNSFADVFVHDRLSGQTTRVSRSAAQAQGNSISFAPAISADGRFVAFQSNASNLVARDTNNFADVFVVDRQSGFIRRESVSSTAAQANGPSSAPSISADGRFIAFQSTASSLVSGDTNNMTDVFVRDRVRFQTTRASVSSAGAQGNQGSFFPAISADGRFVAFHSSAANLVAGDTNSVADVFVRDRQSALTERVSVTSAGAQGAGVSSTASISADGRFVAFASHATNLAAGDTNGVQDVFVRDRQSGLTTRVSLPSGGAQANGVSSLPSISANGAFVVFTSLASNLVVGDTNSATDVFVHDQLLTGP